MIKEEPEDRRTLLTLLAQEFDVSGVLIKILNNTTDQKRERFSITDYSGKKVFIYSLKDSPNPLKQKTYSFHKLSRGYERWDSPVHKKY